MSLNGYDQLLFQSTVDLATNVQFTGNQVDFYGTELSAASLELTASTMATHLDETNVNIGSLTIMTDMTLTQGFVRAGTLKGSGQTFYVSSGMCCQLDVSLIELLSLELE